ncbi:lebercilin-like [Crotalus adamanteus]|uniref:Lebercilin-like protein n=1 Tax=Crotalus adamanteus TaxID=8729 RepID=A0AAW1BJF1_CROAD
MMVSPDTSLHYTIQEEKACGECRKSESSNNSPDSSETPTSEEGGSFTIPLLQQPETTEWNLPEKKKENHLHAKGGKTLPKKKPQQTSQEEERRASNKLREVQAELLKTTDALQALQKLSEEKKLGETGELMRKLTSYTQKLEASDKRIQDLEKQLLLNTTSFNHQLVVAKKKTIEAQSSTANLQLEIESLKLKLKERERELSITNIYAHRLRKSQSEKADSCFSPKVVKVSKAIQVNISLKPRTLGKGEPEGSRMTFHEGRVHKPDAGPQAGCVMPKLN